MWLSVRIMPAFIYGKIDLKATSIYLSTAQREEYGSLAGERGLLGPKRSVSIKLCPPPLWWCSVITPDKQ